MITPPQTIPKDTALILWLQDNYIIYTASMCPTVKNKQMDYNLKWEVKNSTRLDVGISNLSDESVLTVSGSGMLLFCVDMCYGKYYVDQM